MSNTENTYMGRRLTCKRWIMMIVLLLLASGCSFHNGQLSYFNMLDAEKRTPANIKAAETFWSAVRPIKTLSKSHYTLGRYYQEQGKHDKAIKEFAKALRNDNSFCKAHNGIAMSYDAMRQCDAAHKSYEEGLTCDSKAFYLYNNYACSSLLCGKYKQGVALLEKARQLKKGDERIANNLRLAQSFIETKKTSPKIVRSTPAEPENRTALSPSSETTPTTQSEKTSLSERLEVVHPTTSKTEKPASTINTPKDAFPQHSPYELQKNNTPTAVPKTASPNNSKHRAAEKSQSHENNIILSTNAKKRPDSSTPSIPHSLLDSTIEVSNGNGVTGMAGRSARYLKQHGFQVGRITNANNFGYSESIIFYRDGYLQVARKLAQIIPGAQDIQKVNSLGRSSIGVRLLLGKDLVSMHFPDDFYFKRLAHATR